MGVWSRVVGLAAAAAASRPDLWRGRPGADVTVLAVEPVGSGTEPVGSGTEPVEHAGADDSQQTIDWLAELRATGAACGPAWEGERDPDVGRMAHAIDEAVRVFRARLDEAVVELCGQVPSRDQWSAHRGFSKVARETTHRC